MEQFIIISGVFIFLVVLIVLQQFFYMRQIQKLVDKVMSRSYTEYVKATDKPQPKIMIPENPEDLTSLSGINL